MSFIKIGDKDLPVRRFKWSLADITDHRNQIKQQKVSTVDVLARILRAEDPDNAKSLARLRRVYSKM